MREVDYDFLIKSVPELYKFFLNSIESKINEGDAEEVYSALNNYQQFRDVLGRNNIFYKEFDDVYNELEKIVTEIPNSIKTFNQKVIEDYGEKRKILVD